MNGLRGFLCGGRGGGGGEGLVKSMLKSAEVKSLVAMGEAAAEPRSASANQLSCSS